MKKLAQYPQMLLLNQFSDFELTMVLTILVYLINHLMIIIKFFPFIVRPHLTPHEFNTTERIVGDFRKQDGPKLQGMLLKHAETHKNWVRVNSD